MLFIENFQICQGLCCPEFILHWCLKNSAMWSTHKSSYASNYLIVNCQRDEYPCHAKQWPTTTSSQQMESVDFTTNFKCDFKKFIGAQEELLEFQGECQLITWTFQGGIHVSEATYIQRLFLGLSLLLKSDVYIFHPLVCLYLYITVHHKLGFHAQALEFPLRNSKGICSSRKSSVLELRGQVQGWVKRYAQIRTYINQQSHVCRCETWIPIHPLK